MEDQIEAIKEALNQVFEQLGFNKIKVRENVDYEYKGWYYHLTYIAAFNGFVIEAAENLDEAQKMRYEDGNMILINDDLHKMKQQLKEVLEKGYLD